MNRPTRHSYSSISTYKECPREYYYSYVLKLPSPPSAPMMRGTRLHKLCEDYMADPSGISPVPYDVKKIGLKLHHFRTLGATPEVVWLVDENWEPTKDQAKARVKAIVDVHYYRDNVLYCYDYKSGRQYPSHYDQLNLYGVLGLIQYPDARRVETGAIYIDSGITAATDSMLREMLEHSRKRWDGDIVRMERDTRLDPTPGDHCKRCTYSKYNGGPCEAAASK